MFGFGMGMGLGLVPVDRDSLKMLAAWRLLKREEDDALQTVSDEHSADVKRLDASYADKCQKSPNAAAQGAIDREHRALTDKLDSEHDRRNQEIKRDFLDREWEFLRRVAGSYAKIVCKKRPSARGTARNGK